MAGFSWWGAWGPAIGVGDGGKGVAFPHYTPKNPITYFFGQAQCKIRHFPDKCRVKCGHFVNFGQKCLAPATFD